MDDLEWGGRERVGLGGERGMALVREAGGLAGLLDVWGWRWW